jgi:hypothetical protein
MFVTNLCVDGHIIIILYGNTEQDANNKDGPQFDFFTRYFKGDRRSGVVGGIRGTGQAGNTYRL